MTEQDRNRIADAGLTQLQADAAARTFELYTLPNGDTVRIDATVSRGAATITYQMIGGEVVTATAVDPARIEGWKQLVRRYPHARILWDAPIDQIGHVRAYSIEGRRVLILDYSIGRSGGWSIYVDPFPGQIDQTFEQLDAFVNGRDFNRIPK